MSEYLTAPLYNGRGMENQLKNIIFNAHDLCCGCPKPNLHLHHLLQLPTCHSTEKDTTGGEKTGKENGPDDAIDEGDLEAIFAQNDEELG